MNVNIHIGTPKTGSSFLQRKLFANKEELAGLGFEYLTLGKVNNRSQIIDIKKSSNNNGAAEVVLELLNKAKTENIILSDEVFVTLDNDLISQIATLPSIKFRVICFIRSPASYAESAYKQWLFKSDKFNSFDDFVENWAHPNWLNKLKLWGAGNNEISLFPYIPKNISVISQFNSFIGKECSFKNDIDESDNWGANPSFNKKGIVLAKKLSKYVDDSKHVIQNFLLRVAKDECFNKERASFALMSEHQATTFNDKFRWLLSSMEKEFDVKLVDDLFQYDLSATYDSSVDIWCEEDYVKFISKIIG